MTGLQIFLLVNVFLIGVLTAVAVRHAVFHFAKKPVSRVKPAEQTVRIPPALRDQLIERAVIKHQSSLDHSAELLERDLQQTTTGLNQQLQKVGRKIIDDELQRYQKVIDDLHRESDAAVIDNRKEVNAYQTELKQKLEQDVAAEKQRLIEQIDTKLADAVISFLLETLKHDVDLGAQTAYLIQTLDDHKEELKRSVNSEV